MAAGGESSRRPFSFVGVVCGPRPFSLVIPHASLRGARAAGMATQSAPRDSKIVRL